MVTLRDAKVGQTVRVCGIGAGLELPERRRLNELGFCEGAHVRCLRRVPLGGPHVYEVSGSVFSLEARLVAHIDVTHVIESSAAPGDAALGVRPLAG